MAIKYFYLGSTDTVNTCDCCGKTGIKRTVVLDTLDSDNNQEWNIHYFGTTCAKKALNYGATNHEKRAMSQLSSHKSAPVVIRITKAQYNFALLIDNSGDVRAFNTKNNVELASRTAKDLYNEYIQQ
jgi:hypothetical protein